jgi:hypothetical protein
MQRILLVTGLTLMATTAHAQGHRYTPGSDTSTWMGVSGQLRLRAESWAGYGAGSPATADLDDGFGLSRLMVRAEAHLQGRFAFVAELKSSLVASRSLPGGSRPSDEDVFDLQQLYAEAATSLGHGRLTARAGRFELALGRERLASPLDWSNSRRTFQGASLRFARSGADAQFFWTRPVQVRREKPNIPDSTKQFYGVHLGRSWPKLRAELFWLRSESRSAAFNGTSGYERRHTIGYRLNRRPVAGRFDADVEMAWQSGSVGASRVTAWMIGSQAGWTFAGAGAARVYAGFDYGSGDDTTGGTVQTFNQLFPLSHAYLGYEDVHGRQNVVALNIGGTAKLLRDLPVQLDVWEFRRASTGDALYGADASVTRAAGSGLPARVGTEVDLTVRRAFARGRIALQAGASRYFAGAFLEQSGPAGTVRDITWVYAQATATF